MANTNANSQTIHLPGLFWEVIFKLGKHNCGRTPQRHNFGEVHG
jgi:hypothetical protein